MERNHTPPPRYFVRECASEKRTNDRCYAVCRAYQTSNLRPLLRLGSERNDCECPRPNACSTESSNRPADYEYIGGRGHTTNQAPQLEQEQSKEEGDLERKVFVRFSPRRLGAAERHEVRRAI